MDGGRRRVAVTGVGVVSSCGIGVEAFWSGLFAAPADGLRRVTDFDPTPWFDNPKEVRRADRFQQFALALDHLVGSLVPGKWADITAVSLSALELQPVYNPVSHLIYAAGRQHVSDVWVGGRRRVADGALIGVDSAALSAKAQRWAVRARSAQKAASEAKA